MAKLKMNFSTWGEICKGSWTRRGPTKEMEELLLHHNMEFPRWPRCCHPASTFCAVRNLCFWVRVQQQRFGHLNNLPLVIENVPKAINPSQDLPIICCHLSSRNFSCSFHILNNFLPVFGHFLLWKNSKAPFQTPLFHAAQTGMFPDVLSKLCMREEPWVSQPCVVSRVTWHITSFFWVHGGKVTGWSWNWLKVQLNLVEKFLFWPSQALAAFQAHDVHTSLMQPPALESCRAGAGEMSGSVAWAATPEGTQPFPALPHSSLEFMTCSLSQCIPTEQQILLSVQQELPPTPRPWPQPCSRSCPWARPPSQPSPLLLFLSPVPWQHRGWLQKSVSRSSCPLKLWEMLCGMAEACSVLPPCHFSFALY